MTRNTQSISGFSLLEFSIACGVLTVLAAVAVPVYQNYSVRAQATEIVLLYDEIRTGIRSEIDQGIVTECYPLRSGFGNDGRLSGYAVNVTVGFDQVTGGYKPVMVVAATRAQHGAVGMGIAAAAYTQLNDLGMVNRGFSARVAVSFSANLSDRSGPDCLHVPASP